MDVVRMEIELNKVFLPAVAKSYINNQKKEETRLWRLSDLLLIAMPLQLIGRNVFGQL